LGINPETLRNWVTQAEIDGGVRPGTTTDDAQRIAELEWESRELRSRLLHRCTSGQGVATRSSFSPRGTISTSIDPARRGRRERAALAASAIPVIAGLPRALPSKGHANVSEPSCRGVHIR